jgi:hypothetical protein
MEDLIGDPFIYNQAVYVILFTPILPPFRPALDRADLQL